MKSPNRFLSRPKARRMVAFVTASFPRVDHEFAYALVQRLGMRIDADVRFPYSDAIDLRSVNADVKAWMSRSLIAPYSPHQSNADIAHFREAHRERFDSTLARIADSMGMSSEDLLARYDVRAAFSLVRITKAWAPDVLLSFHSFEGSLQALLAHSLLNLPRVLVLYDLERTVANPSNALLPLHLEQAIVIAVPTAELREELSRQFGAAIAAKTVTMQQADWEAECSRRIVTQLRRQPAAINRIDLGPEASFRTSIQHEPRAEVTPFAVVGAERTGSNLLIDMLVTHPQIVSAGELFNTRMIDDGTLDTQLPEDVDKAALVELRRLDPGACIKQLLHSAQRRSALAFGFKLLYYHATANNPVVDYLLSVPNLRIVHLVREDRLARWVSQVRAQVSDSWWVAADQAKAPKTGAVQLDPIDTLFALEFGELQEERCRATFARTRVLELTYEELAANLGGCSARVQDFLGVPRQSLQPQSQKTGERNVRQMVANWTELADAFADSRWAEAFMRE